MFITALFIIIQNPKTTKMCLHWTEEILLYVYVIGYYSEVKTVDRCHNIDDSNE